MQKKKTTSVKCTRFQTSVWYFMCGHHDSTETHFERLLCHLDNIAQARDLLWYWFKHKCKLFGSWRVYILVWTSTHTTHHHEGDLMCARLCPNTTRSIKKMLILTRNTHTHPILYRWCVCLKLILNIRSNSSLDLTCSSLNWTTNGTCLLYKTLQTWRRK